MAEPRVTVAVPFAGGSLDFLRRALESLSAQDFGVWAAVVLDDTQGGSEAAASLVGAWGDSRLRYLRNKGDHGIGNAWNACIEAVQSELFCLLHADDELEPAYLSTMVEL